MQQTLQNGSHLARCVKEEVLFEEVACLPQRWFSDLPCAALPLRVAHGSAILRIVAVVVVGAGLVLQRISQHGAGHDVPSICHQGFMGCAVADDGWPDVAHEKFDVVVLIDVKYHVKNSHSHLGTLLPRGQKPAIGVGGQEVKWKHVLVIYGAYLATT